MNTTTNRRATTDQPDTRAPEAAETSGSSSSGEWVAYFAFAFAAMAMIGAVIAIGIALRAVETANERIAAAPVAAAPAGPVTVTLTDFAFSPSTVEIAAGSTIELVNEGFVEHNAAVRVGGLSSPMIGSGESTIFDVSSLAPGTYEMICEVVGHESLGMVATLIVS